MRARKHLDKRRLGGRGFLVLLSLLTILYLAVAAQYSATVDGFNPTLVDSEDHGDPDPPACDKENPPENNKHCNDDDDGGDDDGDGGGDDGDDGDDDPDVCEASAKLPLGGAAANGPLAVLSAVIPLRRPGWPEEEEGPSDDEPRRTTTRRTKTIAGAILLIAAATLGFLLMRGGETDGYAKIKVYDTNVGVRRSGAQTFSDDVIAPLRIGEAVRTDDTGRARLDYPDGSLTRLDHNTTFTVRRLVDGSDSKQISMRLQSGRIWNRVEKLTRRADRYDVQAGTAVATVRGTGFMTEVRDGRTYHITVDGLVSVNNSGEMKLTAAGGDSHSQNVGGGQCYSENSGGPFQACQPTAEQLEFIKLNIKLDAQEFGVKAQLPAALELPGQPAPGEAIGQAPGRFFRQNPLNGALDPSVLSEQPEERPAPSIDEHDGAEDHGDPSEEPEVDEDDPIVAPDPPGDDCEAASSERSSGPSPLALVLFLISLGISWARPRRRRANTS
jgi:ferric-dicitrate binding protein FerR (iron transport regulator)